jgi:hypothetical protein
MQWTTGLITVAVALLSYLGTPPVQAGTITMTSGDDFRAKLGQLNPGGTLLLEDGTYPPVEINCATGPAKNGTEKAPITLQARHERRARIRSDGSVEPLWIYGCRYWNIVGLLLQSADNPNTQLGREGLLSVLRSDYIQVRRNLGYQSNMRKNQTGFNFLYDTTHSLMEENEVYVFGNNGFGAYQTQGPNTFRRNYLHARTAGHTAPGAAMQYTADNALYENNIIEQGGIGVLSGRGHRFLGNIVFADHFVFGHGYPNSRHAQYGGDNEHNVYEHNVSYNIQNGGQARSTKSYINHHMTILGGDSTNTAAFYADNQYDSRTPGLNCCSADGRTCPSQCEWHIDPHVTITDMLIGPGPGFGLGVGGPGMTATLDHVNIFGRTTGSMSASGGSPTHSMSMDPQMGSCIAWIPDGSPMKGRASDGGDLGATVLYRYEDGKLTKEGLWAKDGSFLGCGAIVPGVNDVLGQSCFDVHQRLNINTNGCPFPKGYKPGTGDKKRPAPQNLPLMGQ